MAFLTTTTRPTLGLKFWACLTMNLPLHADEFPTSIRIAACFRSPLEYLLYMFCINFSVVLRREYRSVWCVMSVGMTSSQTKKVSVPFRVIRRFIVERATIEYNGYKIQSHHRGRSSECNLSTMPSLASCTNDFPVDTKFLDGNFTQRN